MPASTVHWFVCLFLAASTLAAAADNVGDPKKGEAIVRTDCSGCHRVPGAPAPENSGAPDFAQIANMESATVLSIRVFLRTAHRNRTMPNLNFSETEIDDIATYILSLRSR